MLPGSSRLRAVSANRTHKTSSFFRREDRTVRQRERQAQPPPVLIRGNPECFLDCLLVCPTESSPAYCEVDECLGANLHHLDRCVVLALGTQMAIGGSASQLLPPLVPSQWFRRKRLLQYSSESAIDIRIPYGSVSGSAMATP